MHAHLSAQDHQGIPHVVAGVSHVDQFHAFHSSQVFFDGQQICQHLGGMVFIGQSVPDRHAGILCQLFHDFLSESPVFDAVIDPSQDSGSVFDALFLTDLRAFRVQIGGSHAQIVGSHFKGAAGPGAGLFKDQRYVLSF